jgi:hypothetical protein
MSNQVIERKPNGQFAKGVSGNLGGNAQRTRHIFNKAFLEALAADFRKGGPEAIAKVRKYQPAAYMKICALLVPRELKLEHSGGVKGMSDEQLEAGIEDARSRRRRDDARRARRLARRHRPARRQEPGRARRTMAFTLILWGASCAAMARVRLATPPLAAE